jgi:hypothetical protein
MRLGLTFTAAFGMSVLVWSSQALATFYTGSGPVAAIVTNDSTWGADADYFVLSGVTSLGTCPAQGGMVLFLLKDDAKGQRQFALILAARASGAQVTADVDDAYKSPGGICYLRHLTE